MGTLIATLRQRLAARRDLNVLRRREGFFDGTEKPDFRPPGRYARGNRATPAPPPASF